MEVAPTLGETDLGRLATAWRTVDPNPLHQDAVGAAIRSGESAVKDLFGAPLRFGTAGLRGRLGPGPGAMNRVLVRLVAASVGQLVQDHDGSSVVVGYDARHQSSDFALDAARVLAAMGIDVTLIDGPAPTPVLAFAVRHLGADAGVMVTASHNPRSDNGYKVYGPDGSLLTAPADAALARHIMSTPLVDAEGLAAEDDPRISRASDELIQAYVSAARSALRPGSDRTARVAYTPLHGVGSATFLRAFREAGFPDPTVVPEQQEPDGDFPTCVFPNPEEPGVLDLLIRTATAANCDLALANDPDADRLAVLVPADGGWRLLTGDEVGCLVAEYLLSTPYAEDHRRLVINTVVSSRMLRQIASHHHAEYVQTLTGFKWIMHAQANHPDAEFIVGYEEALGYAVGSEVRDKDGISAALVVAEMASALAALGSSILGALAELHERHGVHIGGQRSVRFESGGPTPTQVMDNLRTNAPSLLGDSPVQHIQDLLAEEGPLPATDAVILETSQCRVIVRPSGTEAKLKVYGECWRQPEPSSGRRATDRAQAHHQLTTTINALVSLVSDPERSMTRGQFDALRRPTDDDIDERATTLFASAPTTMSRSDALRLAIDSIDLTTLAGDDTNGRVRALCAQARRPDPTDATVGPTAAVCVYPNLVALAAELTAGSGVAVASVAGAFPSGLSSLEVRLSDIAEAVCAGADEIDVVLNRAAFLAGDHAQVSDELRAMRQQIGGRVMKVILETGELETAQAIRAAADLAITAGADWIKTSTGKSATGASPVAVLVMAEVIAEHARHRAAPAGLKISGGVRTSDDALGYLAIIEAVLGPEALTPSRVRFGASGLLTTLVTDLANEH